MNVNEHRSAEPHRDRQSDVSAGLPARPTPPAAALDGRERAVVFFFLAYLAVQILLPLRGAGDGDLKRFAWRMYSILVPRGGYAVEMVDGTIDTIQLRQYVVAPRMEVNLSDRLPPHLCEVFPDGTAVRRTDADGTVEAIHPCR